MVFTEIGSDRPAARGEAKVVTGSADWRRPTAVFVGLFSVCWLLLYVVHAALPLVQSGALAINAAKFDRLAGQPMFAPGDRTRIMVFGNSKVVSGFDPSQFDAAFGPGVRSYNLGLPGDEHFVPLLEAALAAGNIPTHVLVTLPWDAKAETAPPLAILYDDNRIINTLLPFRAILRDLVLFAYNNRFNFVAGIRYAKSQLDLMVENRGWYFIRWQSHFLNDELPDGFTIPTDRPDRIEVRQWPAHSLARDRLMQLATQYGFQVLLVPSYRRSGEFAPAPSADADRDTVISTSPRVRLIGPDYWTYPTHSFADPVHLNPPARLVYTADLAALLQKHRAF